VAVRRGRAVATTVAVLLFGQVSLTACGGEGGNGTEVAPSECRTSSLELGQVRPASSPRQAVQDLVMSPGEAPGQSLVRITDVVELADDRARVDVTMGNWEGGYEVERRGDGWVPVATVSCGEPVECSDLVLPDAEDAYVAVLCAEPTG
jgi:hypothetical protein